MRALFLPALISLASVSAQTLTPSVLTPLSETLNETSGLLVINGQVWTQLDSGNPNVLYEVDPTDGEVLRVVTVTNASNVDWEDIAADENWLYIGDFGNNAGSRTDLRVYRVPLADVIDPGTTEVLADTIRFAYADQTDFTPADMANNWDCEAMVAVNDSLFLFTKNWVNSESYLYALPAEPGDHLAMRRDTLDTDGLITGASYDALTGSILLCGYTTTLSPFIWTLSGYNEHAFFNGVAVRHPLQLFLTQMEGIAWNDATTAYLSNEDNPLSTARLWELEVDLSTRITGTHLAEPPFAFVDHAQRELVIQCDQADVVRMIDASGRTVMLSPVHTGQNRVGLQGMQTGVYVVLLSDSTTPIRVMIVR